MVSKAEKRSYGLFFLGQNMMYLFVMNYIQNYFTDVVGISVGVVAIIILIARIWDAINDPLFGIVVDRGRMKGGRYKPWLNISAYLVPIVTILLFCVPMGLPLMVKTILCGAIYIIWDMAYTTCDVPIFSLTTALTSDVKERTGLIAFGRIHSFIGIVIVMLLTVPGTNLLTSIFHNQAFSWLIMVVLFAIPAFFLMRPIGKKAVEREINQDDKPISLKFIFKYLTSNKYLAIFYGAMIIASLTNTTTILPLYFANINLGNSNLYIVVVIATMICSPIVSILLPKLTKKFDKFHIYLVGTLITIVFSIISYFVGYEGARFIPFLIISAIKGIGFSCSTVMMYMFSADCIEYGAYKSGKRADGVTFSIQTFATKMTGAISGFVAMGLLGWLFHYQSSYYVGNELVIPTQPISAVNGIWFMYSIFPAIGASISFVILLIFYKLRDKDIQIISDINSGKLERAEGEKLLRTELVNDKLQE
jgi:sugar (glycoside-pentoside-hexuronide) transporter